jgi:hexosaminidase
MILLQEWKLIWKTAGSTSEICTQHLYPIFEINKKDSATIIIKLSTEIEGLSIHYSFDNSFPDNYYPAYSSPLIVPKDAAALKVITYRDNKPIGRLIVMPIAEMRKRAGIK